MQEPTKFDGAPGEEQVLAALPPSNWNEARRRHALLVRYMHKESPSTDDAKRCAAAMGVTIKTLYRLVRSYAALRAGSTKKTSLRGLHSVLSPETDAIVASTMNDLGPNATDVAVRDEARRRSLATGTPVASLNAIRTRRSRKVEMVNLTRRLKLNFNLIVDCCPLDFNILPEASGSAQPAIIAAVQDGRTGAILAWNLFAGDPSGDELASLIEDSPCNWSPYPLVAAVWTARRALNTARARLAESGFVLDDTPSVRLRPGSALVPVLGLRVGRISFRPWRKTDSISDAPSLPLPLARDIVAKLIKPTPMVGHARASRSSAKVNRSERRRDMIDEIADIVARTTGADVRSAARAAHEICQTISLPASGLECTPTH